MTMCHLNSASETQKLHASKLAEVALERYGLRDARLRFLRQRVDREIARVVSPTKGEFVLRMYSAPPVESDIMDSTVAKLRLPLPNRLRSQLMWLSALGRETDLLVPEPVPKPDGSLVDYVSYHPQHPGRYCCLLRWVPGEPKGVAGYSPADISLLGSYVAGLHNHAQRYQVPKGAVLPQWTWEREFGETMPLWSAGEAYFSASEMEMFRAVARRVREDLERLGKGPEVFGLIHRDLSLDNVIFDGEMVGAIDFDLCGHGYYPFDLAVVLLTVKRHHARWHRGAGRLEQLRKSLFTWYRGAGRLEQLRESLLEGYGRGRDLPDAQRESIDSFEVLARVADVNQRLRLLRSEDTASQARQAILRFLRDEASWLRELSRKWE